MLPLGLVLHSAGPKSLDCGRGRHWLEIIHQSRQVFACLINGRSEGRWAVWGAAGTQLCIVVLSQPQADDTVDVAAVLNRWYLVVLHEGRFWFGAR